MIDLMTEVEQAVVDNLKKFSEMVLSTESSTVAICVRCRGQVPLYANCLKKTVHSAPNWLALLSTVEKECRCPRCGIVGKFFNFKGELLNSLAELKGKRHTPLSRHVITVEPIPHYIVRETRYLVEYKTTRTWFGLKKMVEKRWVTELTVLSEVGVAESE